MDQIPDNWDNDLIAIGGSFLQSAGWAQFQAEVGVKPHFLRGEGWSCLLLEKHNRIGRYVLSQYGPTVDSAKALSRALQTIKTYSKSSGAAWATLEPMSPGLTSEQIQLTLRTFKAKPPARHREPDLTRIIDLAPSEDKLLAAVSQSTRSFIRKNQRENLVNFKTSNNPKEISIFIKMLGAVSQRKNVYFFPDSYFEKQAQILMPKGMLHLEFAYEKTKPIAAAVLIDYAGTCTYLYAGSLPEARKLNVSALLLWQAILNAKARGNKQMDLYGIAPQNAPASHPWAGFTSFKAKFGGQEVQYAGTWDIPLSTHYSLYKTAHKARKLLKR